MASKTELECLDDEVKELLLNYKFKKATVYEPCTKNNVKECLIGLSEEFDVHNISYVFNPYCDITKDQTLRPKALVKFINAVWALLHYHKTTADKADKLTEENHILQHLNKQLNGVVGKLKEEANVEKHEAKTSVAAARRISDHFDEIVQTLAETKAKLTQVNKQKEASEKSLRNEITRLKLENEKLSDRLRSKSGGFKPCSEVCDSVAQSLKERVRRQQALITKLQANLHEIRNELVAIKEKIILHGF